MLRRVVKSKFTSVSVVSDATTTRMSNPRRKSFQKYGNAHFSSVHRTREKHVFSVEYYADDKQKGRICLQRLQVSRVSIRVANMPTLFPQLPCRQLNSPTGLPDGFCALLRNHSYYTASRVQNPTRYNQKTCEQGSSLVGEEGICSLFNDAVISDYKTSNGRMNNTK